MTDIRRYIVRGRRAIEVGSDNDYDAYTNVVDTLANIMHYCERHGIDFDSALRTARVHFEVEIHEED